MAGEFFKDLFNDTALTALTSHTPDIGSPWIAQTGVTTGTWIIDSTGDRAVSHTDHSTVLGDAASGADYEVEANVLYISQLPAEAVYFYIRASAAAETAYYYGFAGDGSTTTNLAVGKFIGGANTSLGTAPYPVTLVTGTVYNILLRVAGTTITCYFDGTLVFTKTDSSISAAGRLGMLWFGNPITGGLRVVDIQARPYTAPVVVPVTDANMHFSDGNWVFSGSTYAQTNYRGASLLTAFTGTSAVLDVDISPLSGGGATADQYPWIRAVIDGGSPLDHQLLSTDTAITLATGLSAGTHTLDLYVFSTDSFLDRWNTPSNVVRINSLTIDAGASSAARNIFSDEVWFFGDSITEGDGVYGSGTGNTGTPPNNDATATWAWYVATYLKARASLIAFGGQSWLLGAAGNPPSFTTGWTLQSSGIDRSFATPPRYVIVNQGTNHSLSASSTVTTWLTSARSVLGFNCKIWLVIPFDQSERSLIITGYNNYVAGAPTDLNVGLIDCGAAAAVGLAGSPSANSFDGRHPNAAFHATLGGYVNNQIKTLQGFPDQTQVAHGTNYGPNGSDFVGSRGGGINGSGILGIL